MSDWKFLEAHRVRIGYYASEPEDGFNGMFDFALPGEPRRIRCVASNGDDAPDGLPEWEHVSVSFGTHSIKTPSWEIMCRVKDLFWEPEDAVIQIHPRASEYLNFHAGCLHLWRCLCAEQPLPPSIFVGPKTLPTVPNQ